MYENFYIWKSKITTQTIFQKFYTFFLGFFSCWKFWWIFVSQFTDSVHKPHQLVWNEGKIHTPFQDLHIILRKCNVSCRSDTKVSALVSSIQSFDLTRSISKQKRSLSIVSKVKYPAAFWVFFSPLSTYIPIYFLRQQLSSGPEGPLI